MSDQFGMTPEQVRKATGITRPQLRYWECLGIITPVMENHITRVWRRYTTANAVKIRRILYMLSEGMTLRGAVAKLPALEARENRIAGFASAGAPPMPAAVPASAPDAATTPDQTAMIR